MCRLALFASVIAFLSVSGVLDAADELITAPKEAPLFQLSNFRTELDASGNTIWVIDFRRTREGSGTLFMKGKTNRGPLSIAAPVSASTAAGTIRLRSFLPNRGQQQVPMELYLVQSYYWGKDMKGYAMVSNAVRLGNPGAPTKARVWTAEETAAHAKYLLNKDDDTAEKPLKSYPVSIDVPADSQVVPEDLKLKRGIPLQACYSKKWNPIMTLSENADGSLNVRWVDYGKQYDCSMLREELIIKNDLVEQLRSDPESVEFVEMKPRKTYKVTIAVPDDSQFVPADAKLKEGTALQACYAGKWNPITHLSHNSDGTLNVRWDDYGPQYDCSMVREELIIKKAVLAKMPRSAPKPAAPATKTAESRTWTDSTGRFKIKAKLVKRTPTQVTLLKQDGRQITLPIAKLSEADRKFLGAPVESENPFE